MTLTEKQKQKLREKDKKYLEKPQKNHARKKIRIGFRTLSGKIKVFDYSITKNEEKMLSDRLTKDEKFLVITHIFRTLEKRGLIKWELNEKKLWKY